MNGYLSSMFCLPLVFEKGEEQDSEVGEEADEEGFDEDADLYSNVLKKMLPGKNIFIIFLAFRKTFTIKRPNFM